MAALFKKKLLGVIAMALTTSVLVACGGGGDDNTDTTAPTTTAAPSVSDTTANSTTLSATINEAGTGYYLVQPAAAVAPTVAAVLAGSSFAMTENIAATIPVGGLVAGNAYAIYFVARDMSGNLQATVQSVQVIANSVPTAQNITVDAVWASAFSTDISSLLADADGDSVQAVLVGYGLTTGDLVIGSVSIVNNVVSITVTGGNGGAFIDYQVTDGKDTQATVYRLIVTNLDGV